MRLSLVSNLDRRLRRLRNREDFQQNPLKAIAKRGYYKVRSRVTSRPWTLTLDDELRVMAPMGSTPGTAIYYLGASEPQTLALFKSLLIPGACVVDVGAHIGEYALVASRAVGSSGWVYAFEPGGSIYPFLEANIRRNDAQNVVAVQMAVSDNDGTMELNLGSDPGHSRLVVGDQGRTGLDSTGIVAIPSTTLDSFAEERGVRIDVLKVDVEGAEFAVLKGARRVLGQAGSDAPVILFEYLPRTWEEYGYTLEDGISYLGTVGYDVFGHTADGLLSRLDQELRDQIERDEQDFMLIALKPEHIDIHALTLAYVGDASGPR